MADEAVRAELHAAIEEAYQHLSGGRLKKAEVIFPFLSRGIGRSTLYRWFDSYTVRAKPGARLAKNARRVIAREQAKGRTEPEAVAVAVGRALEAAPLVALAEEGHGALDVLAKLRQCVENAEAVVSFARKEDGSVKMAKTLLAASEHLRRSVDSVVRLQESIHNVSQIDQFHRGIVAMLEDLHREHPQVAHIVLGRLRTLTAAWNV
jgi:hypothetical protein